MADKLHEFDIEVFASGKWNGDTYTDDDLDTMVKAFSDLQGEIKPPVKLGHNDSQMKEILKDGQPALGWVSRLRKAGSKLIATVTQVPDLVYQAIKAGRYKRVSSEIYWNYKKGGSTYNKVLAGVALLGADIPAVSTLADLEAYLAQSIREASFDRVTAYTFNADDEGKITTDGEEKNIPEKGEQEAMSEEIKGYTDKIAELEAANRELAEKVSTFEQVEQEARSYKDEIEAIRKARADEKRQDKMKVFTDLCDKMVLEGKMPPAVRDTLCSFDKHDYSEDGGYMIQLDTLAEAFKTLSIILDTKEVGTDSKPPEMTDIFAEVDSRVKEAMSGKALSYSDAIKSVLADDPDLASRYLDTTNKA